jgi:predicted  nucleic acid-binding Zn-ribbon protein
MDEISSKKTRDDFSTDSEWYTYMITHEDEMKDENEDDIEDNKKKFPLIIVECQKCGYIIDESELPNPPDENMPYENRLKCPKCGGRKFKQLSKEEKEKIIRARKEKERKEKAEKLSFVKATLKKIGQELEELKEELDKELEQGNITPERYVALLINLVYNIYKYYRNDDRISMFYKDFRTFSYGISENVLSKYYEKEEVEETLDNLLKEYNEVKDFDLIYLNKSLNYAQDAEIVGNSSDIEIDKNEVFNDIKTLEYKIEQQENYNERLEEILQKDIVRKNDIDENSLFKELKRINGV